MKKKKKQRKISGVCSIIMTPKNVPLSSSTNSSTPNPPPQQKHNYSNKCFPLNVQRIKKKKLCFTKLTSVQGGYDGIGWWFQGRYERLWRRWGWHDTVIAIALLFLLLSLFSYSSFFKTSQFFCELCHCTCVTCVHKSGMADGVL